MSRLRAITRKPVYLAIALALVAAGVTAAGLSLRSRDPARSVVLSEDPSPEATTSSASPSPTGSPAGSPSATADPTPSPNTRSPWGDRWIDEPSIDRDATVVAFTVAGDYAPAGETPEFFSDVYVRSRLSHTMSRISISTSGGDANGDSSDPAVSADGTRIAFASAASNLVAGDSNGAMDVFVRDLVRHTTQRISVSSTGVQGNGPSGTWLVRTPGGGERWLGGPPAISADGRYVAFTSAASNLVPDDDNEAEDVFVYDLDTGRTVGVSVTSTGSTGNGRSNYPSMSADGNLVAFETRATNLAPEQREEGPLSDILVRDMRTGTTTLVSLSSQNVRLDGWNGFPAVSPSGRHVAFVHVPDIHDVNYGTPPIDSDGGELLKRDLAKGETKEVVLCDHCRRAALSEDGSIAVYVDAMGGLDKFCYVATGEAHGKYLGACGNRIGISWDGRYVAFPARMDALSDPKDEERFGGPGGAMIYDREKDAFTPAWKI